MPVSALEVNSCLASSRGVSLETLTSRNSQVLLRRDTLPAYVSAALRPTGFGISHVRFGNIIERGHDLVRELEFLAR